MKCNLWGALKRKNGIKINVNGLTEIDIARLTADKILADFPLNKSL